MSLKHWIPAVVAAAMVAAGVSGVTAVQADAAVTLPAKTPQQVLELAVGSHVQAFSGTFTEQTDLGLPQLPSGVASGMGSSAADLSNTLSLLTTPHTARIYVDGPQKQRLQVMEQGAERDVVRNGRTVWAYDSAADTATRINLPAPPHRGVRPDSMHTPPTLPTPQQLADRALAAVTPTTRVTVDAAQRVAGRPAYTLVLTPKTTATLVGQVRIAVDAATGLPLAASVTARGARTPAVSVAYTSITLQAPPAARFAFTPPAGTTVKTITPQKPTVPAKTAQRPARPATIGQGWTTIAALPAGTLNAQALAQPALRELSTAVSGGRMISTSLVSVYITDNGRVYVGSVAAQALLTAAAAQSAR